MAFSAVFSLKKGQTTFTAEISNGPDATMITMGSLSLITCVYFLYRNINRKDNSDNLQPIVDEYRREMRKNITLEDEKEYILELKLKIEQDYISLADKNERYAYEALINTILNSTTFDAAWKAFLKSITNTVTPNVYIYTQLLLLTKTYTEASLVIDDMNKRDVKPNEYVSSATIMRTTNFKDALHVYKNMKENGVSDNVHIYTALLTKSCLEEEALNLYKQAIKNSVQINKHMLSALLSKINNPSVAFDVFSSSISDGVEANIYVLTAMLSKFTSFKDAIKFYNTWISGKVDTNEYVISALFSKAITSKDICQVHTVIEDNSVDINKYVYESIIRTSNDFSLSKKYIESMVIRGIEPDKHIYTALIGNATSYKEAKEVFCSLQESRVDLDSHLVLSLLKNAESNDDIDDVFHLSSNLEIKLDIPVYTEAINKATSSTHANQTYRDILRNGVKPDSLFYSCLLFKIESLDEAESIVRDMGNQNILIKDLAPILLSKVSSVQDGMKCISLLSKLCIDVHFTSITKIFSYPMEPELSAQEVLEWFWGLKLPVDPLNALIKKLRGTNEEEALRILLHYPHLSAGKPIFTKKKKLALDFFKKYLTHNDYGTDACYALAHVSFVNNDYAETLKYLGEIHMSKRDMMPDIIIDKINSMTQLCEEHQKNGYRDRDGHH